MSDHQCASSATAWVWGGNPHHGRYMVTKGVAATASKSRRCPQGENRLNFGEQPQSGLLPSIPKSVGYFALPLHPSRKRWVRRRHPSHPPRLSAPSRTRTVRLPVPPASHAARPVLAARTRCLSVRFVLAGRFSGPWVSGSARRPTPAENRLRPFHGQKNRLSVDCEFFRLL